MLDPRATITWKLPENSVPAVTRALVGRTRRDAEVDALKVPMKPVCVWAAVSLLRLYRRIRPVAVGNRCVWDPSCSRYAELAVRQYGLLQGIVATIQRLVRCRPGRGGVDTP